VEIDRRREALMKAGLWPIEALLEDQMEPLDDPPDRGFEDLWKG